MFIWSRCSTYCAVNKNLIFFTSKVVSLRCLRKHLNVSSYSYIKECVTLQNYCRHEAWSAMNLIYTINIKINFTLFFILKLNYQKIILKVMLSFSLCLCIIIIYMLQFLAVDLQMHLKEDFFSVKWHQEFMVIDALRRDFCNRRNNGSKSQRHPDITERLPVITNMPS